MESTLVKIDADPDSLWREEVANAGRKAASRVETAQEALEAFHEKQSLEADRNSAKFLQVIGLITAHTSIYGNNH